MTLETFFDQIEKVYGSYENENLKKVVKGYLTKDIKQDEISNVLKAILYNHKVKFGVPCIATIEEAIDNAIKKKKTFSPYLVKAYDTSRYNYREQAEENEEFKPVGSLLKELNKK